ncbi:MAG: hypothetical protein WDO68_22865 [Gammaproteobacteria bacterium]
MNKYGSVSALTKGPVLSMAQVDGKSRAEVAGGQLYWTGQLPQQKVL